MPDKLFDYIFDPSTEFDSANVSCFCTSEHFDVLSPLPGIGIEQDKVFDAYGNIFREALATRKGEKE